MVLNTGRPFVLEPFQLDILRDYFDGCLETLVLLPKKNGKTTLFAALALYHVIYTTDAECYVAAASKDQATLLYNHAKGFVERKGRGGQPLPGPRWLQTRVLVRKGTREIRSKCDEGFIRVLASDKDTADGVEPTLALVDELHRHKSPELYGVFHDGLSARDGRIITISTAGDDEESPLGEMRRDALALPDQHVEDRYRRARSGDGAFVMHEWALKPTDDRNDLKLVKRVNPLRAMTVARLAARKASPSMKPWRWARFACGVWVKGENTAIDALTWDALAEDLGMPARSARVVLGLDLGWRIDHAALVPVAWESAERRIVLEVATFAPPVDEDDIVRALIDAHERHPVEFVVYDPNAGGQQMVQLLEKGKHHVQAERHAPPMKFVEHSQDNAPMALAADRLDEALRKGWIKHDGGRACTDPDCRCGGMRGHALNAVEKTLGSEKWKYDRPADAKGDRRRKYPIDALTGLLISHSVAVREFTRKRSKPTFEVIA